MRADVLKGQVTVIMLLVLLEALVLKVVVKALVVGVEEVSLSPLSSTPCPRTRPAALGLGLGR